MDLNINGFAFFMWQVVSAQCIDDKMDDVIGNIEIAVVANQFGYTFPLCQQLFLVIQVANFEASVDCIEQDNFLIFWNINYIAYFVDIISRVGGDIVKDLHLVLFLFFEFERSGNIGIEISAL